MKSESSNLTFIALFMVKDIITWLHFNKKYINISYINDRRKIL